MLNEKHLKVNYRYVALAMEDNTVEFYDPGSVPVVKLADAIIDYDLVIGGGSEGSIEVSGGEVLINFSKKTGVTPTQAVILTTMMLGQMEAAKE